MEGYKNLDDMAQEGGQVAVEVNRPVYFHIHPSTTVSRK